MNPPLEKLAFRYELVSKKQKYAKNRSDSLAKVQSVRSEEKTNAICYKAGNNFIQI